MSNREKYDEAFVEALGVGKDQLDGLEYQSVESWDSVGHMQLVATLEEKFDIFFETEDIINFSSYAKGAELLAKYGIEI